MKPIPSRQRVAAVVAVALALVVAGTAAADPAEEGAALAAEGRCAAAIPLLAKGGPGLAEADRLAWLGRCQLRMGAYTDAAANLGAARRRRPEDAGLALDEAIAHYGVGDRNATAAALGEADLLGTDRAELPLYQGILALDDAEDRRAAELFARARSIAGDAVEPVASYYEGLALRNSGADAGARASLERVVRDWPGSEWADAAEAALRQAEPVGLRRWASLRLGAEYDDNAVLRGRGVVLPEEISDEADERFVWLAHAGRELVETGGWLASAGLTYQGSAHDGLGAFDVHFPSASLWFDRPLAGGWHARLLGSAGYAWVDDDPFLFTHRTQLALFHSDEAGGLTRFHAEQYRDDYKFDRRRVPDADPGGGCSTLLSPCSPLGIDEDRERNRDGNGWMAGIERTRPFLDLGLELRGGLRWHAFAARGREYSFRGPEARIAARLALPLAWSLEAGGAFLHRSFRHATTFPEPDGGLQATQLQNGVAYSLRGTPRTENETRAEVTLGRNFDEWILFELRWAYQRNRSSARVFDFDRHQIGAYLTVGFGE